VEILNFNLQLDRNQKTSVFSALGLVVSELLHSPSFLKEVVRLKYLLGIARHQWFTALHFKKYLKNNHAGHEKFFYCYWLHNSALMLSLLKREKAISGFVARAHSIDLYHHHWVLAPELKVPAFEYTKVSAADAIYPVSRHGEDFLKKKFRPYEKKFACTYLGVSDEGVNAVADNSFTIVSCGNLTVNKRMLELAKTLAKIEFPVTWVHFGDGEQRPEIEKIASSLPPNKNIILKGNTPNSEVRKFLISQPVHLFVNLSIAEGLPVSLMEAASAGIPLLATQVYGNPEIVKDGISGLMIPSNFTTEQLANLLSKIKKDPELRRRLSEGARALYLENFNAKINYTVFANQLSNP